MEYDGRFWGKSLIDFVIADTCTEKIIFQNHSRDICIPNELYQSLHRLFGFNLELSWLDWPQKGQLEIRVQLELDRIQAYKIAFDRD
jgi:hypothetical protein